MKIVASILALVSFIPSIMLVNKVQQLYMRLMGAEMMFFSTKKKLIAIFIVWIIIFGMIAQIFGLQKYFG